MLDEKTELKGGKAGESPLEAASADTDATAVSCAEAGATSGDADSTVVAAGGGADATVIASPDQDKTVITSAISGDATVVTSAGALSTAPVSAFKPVVNFGVSTRFPYALARQVTTNHALFEISSFFEGRESARAPVAVALVLDKSGSMEGRPMEQLKIAVKYLVDRLSPADLLTIVTFGQESDVVMPLRRVVNTELIKQHVDAVRPRGTTNLWAGMLDAVTELLSADAPHHVKRVLMLTDGEANEGITDYQSIVAEVRRRHKSVLTFSTLGMGIEYNDELMMAIAKNTGGNYYFVEHPDEIPAVFEMELGSMFGVVGSDARLVLKLRKGASVERIHGLEFAADGRAVEIEIPPLEAGKSQAVLAELKMEQHPAARFKKLDAELSYVPFGQTARVSHNIGVVFEFTADRDLVRSHENESVRHALAARDISAQLERAGELAKKDAATATMIISQAETMLLEAGRSEDATIIANVKSRLESGKTGEAEKMLGGAKFRLDQDKTQIQTSPEKKEGKSK